MKRRWCAKWVQMCVTVNHYKVTDIFKCSRGERERERKGLIEQIQCPALLIRLISQLPGVNYHTHTSCCCSTYIIITVAKIENNLKLTIWGLPLQTSRTCTCIHICTHIRTNAHAFITTAFPLIFSAWTSWCIPKSPSLPMCQLFFGLISFI